MGSRTVYVATSALMAGALLAAANICRGGGPPDAPPSPASSGAVFERRIRPILDAKNPSSCAECHLSGVDLKDYIRPTEAGTFAALRDAGLVNLGQPEESRVLKFLRMSRPKTPLLTQEVRNIEYAAFRDWITLAAKNPTLASLPVKVARRIGPGVPGAVIRHTRIDAVVASFERNVGSQEGRCMGCHRPDSPASAENVKKYGERVLWFVPGDPEATMQRLVAQGDVNVAKPEESLLLLKPLNRVPHGGGVKMLYGDAGYKLFRAWLEDYTRSVQGRYRNAKDLPAPSPSALVGMDSILGLNGGPAAWANKLLRADVYAWDGVRDTWSRSPVATGERGVSADSTGSRTSTNLIMFLVVPASDPPAPAAQATDSRSRLKPGRYLLKYYCDTEGALNRDYAIPTDAPKFYQGQQEITASWFGGWGKPVTVQVALTNPGTKP